jgi:hypothetical protein
MRGNVAFAIFAATLLGAFILGLADKLIVGETYGAILFYVSLVTAAVIVIVVGLSSSWLSATLMGTGLGFLTPLIYYEGRWIAYLTGWNGLEMRLFLSSLGEMDVTAVEAQALVILLGVVFGIPCGLAGATLGWMASRYQRESLPTGSPSSGPTTS